ncbi:MAG: phage portal protein, partial [Sulfuricaulis sp.]|nr:phage portal protein [Sulfuricaulis sp.]
LPTYSGAETMGLAMAAKKFTAAFFRNGTSQRGIITTPNKLSAESLSAYREQINKIYGGAENAHGWMAFDNGATVSSMDVDPNKAQLIQTMLFAVEDVARFFRVPPHKIQHLARATFSNIEHQAIEYVGDTILPWLVKFEQEYTRKLFSVKEQETLFVEHNLDMLLRADIKTRYESHAIAILNGIMSRNEVRAKENMNAYKGGDLFLVQQNVAIVNDEGGIEPTNKPTEPAGQGAPPVMPPEEKENGATAMDMLKVHMMPVFVDAAERMIAREVKAIQTKKNVTGEWIEKFYAGHEPEVAAAFRAPIASLSRAAGVEPGTMAERYAERHCENSKADLIDIDKWMGERPAEIARQLTDEVCHAGK